MTNQVTLIHERSGTKVRLINSIPIDYFQSIPSIQIRTMSQLTRKNPDIVGETNSPTRALSCGVRQLWEQGLLLDYTILVDNREFPAHKLALAAMSDYFKVMLTGSMKESQESFVKLKGVSAEAVENLLEYIYTWELDLNQENCTEVLAGAVHLQIHTAIVACAQFLVDNLNVENCLDILDICRMYHLNDVEEKVKNYIKKNAQSIIRVGRFDCVHFTDMGLLLDDWHGSEWDLFLCIKQWISSDFTQRSINMDSLLQRVRFSLMSEDELQNVLRCRVYRDSEGSKWRELVEEAHHYKQGPVWVRATQTSAQSQMRGKPIVVAFSSDTDHDEDKCGTEFYGLYDDWCWRMLPPMSHTFPQASVTVINNFLFAVGGCDPSHPLNASDKCSIFDPRVMKWFPAASMQSGRIHFPLVESGHKLFALGGCYGYGLTHNPLVTAKNEMYDLSTNTWSSIASLPRPLRKHSACAYNGFLYVSGGLSDDSFDHNSLGISRHFDCYDVSNNTWQPKAPMTQTRFGHSMFSMKLDGEDAIFVIGLNLDVEYYLPSEDQWTKYVLPFSANLPSYGTLVSDGNTSVYIIAGSALFENVRLDWSVEGDSEDEVDDVCKSICVRLNLGGDQGVGYLDKLPNFPEESSTPLCGMLCVPSDIVDLATIIPPVRTQIIA